MFGLNGKGRGIKAQRRKGVKAKGLGLKGLKHKDDGADAGEIDI
jgi:hypothetical protein